MEDNQFIRKFRKLLRQLERIVYSQNNDCCCNLVTVAQCHTLLEIEGKEKISISQLAGNLNLDKSTVSRTVDGLVNLGYINRSDNPESRRESIIQLTSEGLNVCDSINTSNDTFYFQAFQSLSGKEQEQFMDLLEKIVSNMVSVSNNTTQCCGS